LRIRFAFLVSQVSARTKGLTELLDRNAIKERPIYVWILGAGTRSHPRHVFMCSVCRSSIERVRRGSLRSGKHLSFRSPVNIAADNHYPNLNKLESAPFVADDTPDAAFLINQDVSAQVRSRVSVLITASPVSTNTTNLGHLRREAPHRSLALMTQVGRH
jgi:hypothetical protein